MMDKKLRGRYRKVAAAFVAHAMDKKGMTFKVQNDDTANYILDSKYYVDLDCGFDLRIIWRCSRGLTAMAYIKNYVLVLL